MLTPVCSNMKGSARYVRYVPGWRKWSYLSSVSSGSGLTGSNRAVRILSTVVTKRGGRSSVGDRIISNKLIFVTSISVLFPKKSSQTSSNSIATKRCVKYALRRNNRNRTDVIPISHLFTSRKKLKGRPLFDDILAPNGQLVVLQEADLSGRSDPIVPATGPTRSLVPS